MARRGSRPGWSRNPDRLSNVLKTFNEQFGTLFTDSDLVAKRTRDDIAPRVAADAAYQNAKGQHAVLRAHGPRSGTGRGDATPLEGRHAGLQAVRGKRVF